MSSGSIKKYPKTVVVEEDRQIKRNILEYATQK
jgi:hypothetical protein